MSKISACLFNKNKIYLHPTFLEHPFPRVRVLRLTNLFNLDIAVAAWAVPVGAPDAETGFLSAGLALSLPLAGILRNFSARKAPTQSRRLI